MGLRNCRLIGIERKPPAELLNGAFDPQPKSDLPIDILMPTGGRPLRPPAKFTRHARHSQDHSSGANEPVAEVRWLLGCQRVLVLERREAVFGKGRHIGVVGCLQLDLVEPGCVAGEDQLLGGAVGVTSGAKPYIFCTPSEVQPTDQK